jgi:hypothetical protein
VRDTPAVDLQHQGLGQGDRAVDPGNQRGYLPPHRARAGGFAQLLQRIAVSLLAAAGAMRAQGGTAPAPRLASPGGAHTAARHHSLLVRDFSIL